MSAICRLLNHKGLSQLVSLKKLSFLPLTRHVTLKAVPYNPPPPQVDHDERNTTLKRPTSPHLSIYAIELPSTLSISHRMTGALLAGYTFLLGGGVLVLPHQISHYIDVFQSSHPSAALIFCLKFVLAAPFSYHFCNGIRHLVWDTANFLTIKGVYQTGYFMLACTFIMTVALCCL